MTTEEHPFNIGTNLYGVGACLVFFQLIFTFEIHHRFGPILFCIKNIFWDILSGKYIIYFSTADAYIEKPELNLGN